MYTIKKKAKQGRIYNNLKEKKQSFKLQWEGAFIKSRNLYEGALIMCL